MIILRNLKQKLFTYRTSFPNNLRKDYEFNKSLADSCDKMVIDIQPSDDYIIQFNKSSETNRSRDIKFVSELKTNTVTWFEDGDDKDADTHYLRDMSKTTSSIQERNFVMFSKWINGEDRFNYKIYKPRVIINNTTGERTYYQKIVLATCLYHNNNGSPKAYVKGQEGIGWHKRSKATRKKIKEKKLNTKP